MAGNSNNPDEQAMDQLIKNWLAKQATEDETPAEVQWLDSFLPSIIAVATFGGSITFSLVPAEPRAPSTFDKGKVTTFLALAWLFFLLALGYAISLALVLGFQRKVITDTLKGVGNPSGFSEKWAVIWVVVMPVSLFLQIFILLAFFFLALVVLAYSKTVGIIAAVITGFFALAALVVWVVHNCCGKKAEQNERND